MTCQDVERLGGAYGDGELDLEHALAIEAHAAECQACAARLEAGQSLTRALRSAPYFTAPSGLGARIRARASAAGGVRPERRSPRFPSWLLAAASVAIVVAGAFMLYRLGGATTERTTSAVIDRHIASLMADHLTDVTSTDRHTVKPWFAGRIEFSPPVADLAADGFPLKGGRLDYVDGHAAVALVYKRGEHVINAFTWPTTDRDGAARRSDDPHGYHLIHWTAGGFTWWVVSDLAPVDLKDFATKLAAEAQRLRQP